MGYSFLCPNLVWLCKQPPRPTHVHGNTRTHTHVRAYTYMHKERHATCTLHARTHTCTQKRAHGHMHIQRSRAQMHAHTHTNMSSHTCTHTCTNICMPTGTHVHTEFTVAGGFNQYHLSPSSLQRAPHRSPCVCPGRLPRPVFHSPSSAQRPSNLSEPESITPQSCRSLLQVPISLGGKGSCCLVL